MAHLCFKSFIFKHQLSQKEKSIAILYLIVCHRVRQLERNYNLQINCKQTNSGRTISQHVVKTNRWSTHTLPAKHDLLPKHVMEQDGQDKQKDIQTERQTDRQMELLTPFNSYIPETKEKTERKYTIESMHCYFLNNLVMWGQSSRFPQESHILKNTP